MTSETPEQTPAEAVQTPVEETAGTTTPRRASKPSAKRTGPRKPKLEEYAINAANRWLHFLGLSQRTHDYRKLARLFQEEQPKTQAHIIKLVGKAKKERK